MKKWLLTCVCLCLCLSFSFTTIASDEVKKEEDRPLDLAPKAKAAYVVENATGNVIYAKHETDKLYPASMTKMMGLLLVFEALHNKKVAWDDMVSTSAYAASMGGSQVFLKPNESMSVKDMVKAICIASANDAMVALGEKIAGTNDQFVKDMNDKARELKLTNTNFTNATGLHDPKHYTSAKDMANLARALLREGGDELLKLTSTYDAYIREQTDNKFWLVNTNKLLKQYEGIDGLKTGYTAEALSCITVTAKRKNLRLVAVAMGEPDSKVRNEEVKRMLDYGFSQFDQALLYAKGTKLKSHEIEYGKPTLTNLITKEDLVYAFKKGKKPKEVKRDITITKTKLPYKKGEVIGKVRIEMSDGYYMESDVSVEHDVSPLNYFDVFMRTFSDVFA